MGINSRPSLDSRWNNHHTEVIKGFMGCTVRVDRRIPGEPVYDKATKTYTDPWDEIFTGSARVQPYGLNFDIEVGLDPTSRKLVLIQVAGKDLGIRTGDRVTVISTDNNEELEDYSFEVRGSIAGTLNWATQLICEVDQKHG